MLDQFKACLRAGVPIVAIKSPDQQATQQTILNTFGAKRSIYRWDICGGMRGLNSNAEREGKAFGLDPALTQNPIEALTLATAKMKAQSVLVMMNVHLFLDQPTLIQAVANTRDQFKQDQRILVMLAPDFTLGPELVRDTIVIDEALPGQDAIAEVVKQQFVNGQLKPPTEDVVAEASKILLGCSLFEAEQITATSLTKEGLIFEELWSKKKLLIGQTPGMELWSGGQTFSDIGGLDQWKLRLSRVINGQADIGLILFFDEVEKMFGGAQGDTSGVSQDFHGQWLTWAQDNEIFGAILVGVSGGGKSLSSKAAGSAKKSGRIPVLSCDVGAMKSSLVGSSEARFRNFLKVARALTPGRILVIMTCNDLRTLSPELKARMTLGTFFFDEPSKIERASMWPLYLKKFGFGGAQAAPKDRNGREWYPSFDALPPELQDARWTGREIKACCETAWNEGITLMESSRNIVPVSITDADRMGQLRELAHKSFLSASYEGPYEKDKAPELIPGQRQIGWDTV
jgi:hypothetical protein